MPQRPYALLIAAMIALLGGIAAHAMGDRAETSTGSAQQILVLGGTRETGLEVVKILVARGDKVTALARPTSDIKALEALNVTIAIGDAFDRDSLNRIFQQTAFDAVISSLGNKRGETRRVDFEGNRNAIDAAKAAGVSRYIMVSLIGVGDSHGAVSQDMLDAFKVVIEAKQAAEDYLTASGLDYTIVRAGGLTYDAATGQAMLTEDRGIMGTTTRADLAQLLVACLDDPETAGHIYAAVDKNMVGIPDVRLPATGERNE